MVQWRNGDSIWIHRHVPRPWMPRTVRPRDSTVVRLAAAELVRHSRAERSVLGSRERHTGPDLSVATVSRRRIVVDQRDRDGAVQRSDDANAHGDGCDAEPERREVSLPG